MAHKKSNSILPVIGIILGAAAIIEAVVALWWWAVIGMDSDIGAAHGFTVIILGVASASAINYSK